MSNEVEKQEEKVQPKVVELETISAHDLTIIVKGDEDRTYKFSVQWGSPLDEAYHAALNAAGEIARLYNDAIAQQKKAEEDKEESEEG